MHALVNSVDHKRIQECVLSYGGTFFGSYVTSMLLNELDKTQFNDIDCYFENVELFDVAEKALDSEFGDGVIRLDPSVTYMPWLMYNTADFCCYNWIYDGTFKQRQLKGPAVYDPAVEYLNKFKQTKYIGHLSPTNNNRHGSRFYMRIAKLHRNGWIVYDQDGTEFNQEFFDRFL
jgi:hypothetical protein